METVNTNCKNCGAAIKIDSKAEKTVCEYCGTHLLIKSEPTKKRGIKKFLTYLDPLFSEIAAATQNESIKTQIGLQQENINRYMNDPKFRRKSHLNIIFMLVFFAIFFAAMILIIINFSTIISWFKAEFYPAIQKAILLKISPKGILN